MVPTLLKKIDELKAELSSVKEELENQIKINLAIHGEYEYLTYKIATANYILIEDADMTPALRSMRSSFGSIRSRPHPFPRTSAIGSAPPTFAGQFLLRLTGRTSAGWFFTDTRPRLSGRCLRRINCGSTAN